jgi:hypothetical protein
MHTTSRERPATLFALLGLLVFLGGGGLVGGVAMLMDPSGEPLGLSMELLDPVPVDSFLLPGLLLLTVFGAVPLMAAYGAWALPEPRWLLRLNPWPELHWSWAWSRVTAVLLILWIGLEFLLWGSESPLQPLLLGVGLAILVMCGYPSIRRYMRVKSGPEIDKGRLDDADNRDDIGEAGHG